MFNIRIVKEDIKYLEIEFFDNFNVKESEEKILFEDQKIFKKFDIKIHLKTLKYIYEYFEKSDLSFNFQLKKYKKSKKKIPLKFGIEHKNYNLLSWIVYYKDLSFLYSFQKIGINFLFDTEKAILADDMGLGKTVQTLLASDKLIKKRFMMGVVITCPNSLITNWKNEINKWLPYAKVKEISQSELINNNKLLKTINSNNYILINYEKLNKLVNTLKINKHKFDLLVADEAHRLRVKTSSVSYNFKKISADYSWLLTGTPFENNLQDIKNIISILKPKQKILVEGASITILNSLLRQFTLRRKKKDVLKDLPKKHKNIQYLNFSNSSKNEYLKILKNISVLPNDQKIGKFQNLLRICIENKFQRCLEITENSLEKDSKVVIFSYLVKPLENFLSFIPNELKKKCLLLSGKSTISERNLILNNFKTNESFKVLLISSFLGSVGLTLTEANVAIFLSEYWNPSSNDQAEDRLLRIGQSKEVNIINLRIKDSIEENLEEILTKKTSTNDAIIKSLETEERKMALLRNFRL